jgi:hypothetical protein
LNINKNTKKEIMAVFEANIEEVQGVTPKMSDQFPYLPSPRPIEPPPYTDYDAIRSELLAELDTISDPFEQMVYILGVLMPTLFSMQEQDIASLAYTQDTLSIYGEKLQKAQDAFNAMMESKDGPIEELAANLYYLKEYLEVDEVMDPEARQMLLDEINSIITKHLNRDSMGSWGAHHNSLWHPERHPVGSSDSAYNEAIKDLEGLKDYTDLFRIGESSLSSQSAVVSTLIDHDSQKYESFAALYQDMFKEFFAQVQANVRNLAS